MQQISTFLSLLGRRVCLFKHSSGVAAHLLTSGALPHEFSCCLRYSFHLSSWSKFQYSFSFPSFVCLQDVWWEPSLTLQKGRNVWPIRGWLEHQPNLRGLNCPAEKHMAFCWWQRSGGRVSSTAMELEFGNTLFPDPLSRRVLFVVCLPFWNWESSL